ncbi:KAP family P-loop NTPase fold protein [Candidatus Poriferisodalis sp.]|uniref:KAP family P-loop NTPase fold protein n=1 Tax=Candidatus Poriferisodalis sp. TaxID=3101277 RepID=UPI003B52132F
MPLRPPELEVDDDDPFKNDLLGRKPRVEALTRAIVAEEGPAVISVNGGFGSGKSAFLRMLAANLALHEGVGVQEFNAWQQSHTDNPVIDVVSALAAHSTNVTTDLIQAAFGLGKRILRGLLVQGVKTATAGVVDPEGVGTNDTDSTSVFQVWADVEAQVTNFKEALGKLVQASGGKFVVIIDELDRCHPDYAIDMLAEVRHLFAAPGVVIVLGVNRAELEYRVKEVFGPQTDAAVFLRRYIDLPIHLGVPSAGQLSLFTNTAINHTELRRQSLSSVVAESLAHLVAESFASLRDAQQMAHFVATVADPAGERHEAWQLAALAMLMLRSIDQAFYEEFVAGIQDGVAAVGKLSESLSMMWIQDLEFGDARIYLQRSLLELGHPGSVPTIAREDFAVRYAAVGLGDHETAERIQTQWLENIQAHRFCSASEVAEQIEAMV